VKISIIIPTYNQQDRLGSVIRHLFAAENIDRHEVIIINDGSTDGTHDLLEQCRDCPWLIILHQNNLGRSRARNRGIQHASGEVLLFLDSDILIGPNFVNKHLDAHLSQSGVYIGEIFNITAGHTEQFLNRLAAEPFGQLQNLETEDLLVNMSRYFFRWSSVDYARISWACAIGGNLSVSRRNAEEAGLFDPQFNGWGLEDHEFAFRLRQNGQQFYFLPQAFGYHLDQQKSRIDYGQLLESLLYFDAKHASHPEVRAYLKFVGGKISMQQLFRVTMDYDPPAGEEAVYIRPTEHLRNKFLTIS
jgi:glycosyltransferase involved in cell wall biosynthesis